MNEKTAIVIGGTGQIGQYILEAVLKEGYNTVCISQNKVKEEVKKTFVDYYTFDMSTLEGIEKCCDLIQKICFDGCPSKCYWKKQCRFS